MATGNAEPAARLIQTSEANPAHCEALIQYNLACTFAVLGETDRAIGLLDRAVELGWGDRAWIENDSDLVSLRDDPRFAALLARIR